MAKLMHEHDDEQRQVFHHVPEPMRVLLRRVGQLDVSHEEPEPVQAHVDAGQAE